MIYYIGNNIFEYEGVENASIDKCVEYCKSKSILGLDIETSRKYNKGLYRETNYLPGLDPFLSRIIMLQIGDLDNQFIIDTRVIDISSLKPIIENTKILKVGHNLKFEAIHLKHNYDFNMKNIHDTMICERILYNGEKRGYSLEACAKKHLKIKVNTTEKIDLFRQNEFEVFNDDFNDELEYIEVNKNIRNDFSEWQDKPFTLDQIKYGTDDIIMPLQLYYIQIQGRIINEELYLPIKAFNLENKIVLVLANMYLRGVNVDIEGWLNLYQKNKVLYDELKAKLNTFIVTNYLKFTKPPDLFESELRCSIDWQSPKQVVDFVKHLGVCPLEKSIQTGKLEYTVGAKAVLKILDNNYKEMFFAVKECEIKDTQTFLLNFLILKRYQQLSTTFGKEWLEKYIHPLTNKVHCNFIQLMNTTRMSSTSPNMQQIPSGKEWRKLFIGGEGYSCISTDFSAQEARVAAEVTEIKPLRDIFNFGHPIFKDDIHSMNATNMFRIIKNDNTFVCDKNINKVERGIAKNMLFKLLFGGSEYTVALDLGVILEEGTKFYNAFFDAYPGLKENFEQAKKLAIKRGWIELDPITKARYFYPHFQEMQDSFKAAMSYYPEDYKTYTAEEKKEFKDVLYNEHPYVRDYWKTYGVLKGKLERASLNYRIQSLAAKQSKLVMLYLEEDNTSLDEGLRLFVHDEAYDIWKKENAIRRSEETLSFMQKSGTIFTPNVKAEGVSEIGDYWIH